jgi:hypothetical protein
MDWKGIKVTVRLSVINRVVSNVRVFVPHLSADDVPCLNFFICICSLFATVTTNRPLLLSSLRHPP